MNGKNNIRLKDNASGAHISSMARRSIAYRVFFDWSIKGYRYCIWKSIDRFEEGTLGKTDFDVLVDVKEKDQIFDWLTENGWIRLVAESWRTFPSVYDFVSYDEECRAFIHIHLHFKLVMGESRVKSLILPFEDMYLSSAQTVDGVTYAKPELELIVFLLRLSLKSTPTDYVMVLFSCNSSAMYRNHRAEWDYIVSRSRIKEVERLLSYRELSFIDNHIVLEAFYDLETFTWRRRRRIRQVIKPMRKYTVLSRLRVKQQKKLQQLFYGAGKVLPGQGVSFAFCGADGSGKTSVAREVTKRLSAHFKVNTVYLGGSPQSKGWPRLLFRTFVFPPFALLRRLTFLLQGQAAETRIKNWFYGLEETMIANEKIKRYRFALTSLAAGEVVIFDRFPLFPGFGDGGLNSSFELLRNGCVVKNVLFNMPNKTFVLDVSLQVAIERKPDHEQNILKEKTAAYSDFVNSGVPGDVVLKINADEPFDLVVDTIMKHVSKELASDH